jgi:hypothetical protein
VPRAVITAVVSPRASVTRTVTTSRIPSDAHVPVTRWLAPSSL